MAMSLTASPDTSTPTRSPSGRRSTGTCWRGPSTPSTGAIGPLDAAGFLEGRDKHIAWNELLGEAEVLLTPPGSKEWHQPVALFTAEGLRAACTAAGLEPVVIASSNPLVPQATRVPSIEASPAAVASLVELEVALSSRPGLLDTGEHLILLATRD